MISRDNFRKIIDALQEFDETLTAFEKALNIGADCKFADILDKLVDGISEEMEGENKDPILYKYLYPDPNEKLIVNLNGQQTEITTIDLLYDYFEYKEKNKENGKA